MQICIAAIVEAGLLPPSGICCFMRKRQLLTVCPKDYSGNGMRDAFFDYQFAMSESGIPFATQCGTLSELLELAFETSPAIFTGIGWDGVLPPDIV